MAVQRARLTNILCELIHGLDAVIRPACGTAVMLPSCAAQDTQASTTRYLPALKVPLLGKQRRCALQQLKGACYGEQGTAAEGHTRGGHCAEGIAAVWPRRLRG